MKKKQFLLGLCLWLAFNGCATLIRFWAQVMGLYPDMAVNPMTAVVLPAVAGLIISHADPCRPDGDARQYRYELILRIVS
jgi:hypothetical protein